MNKGMFCALFVALLLGLAACTKIDHLAMVTTVTKQSVLQLEKSISPVSVFMNGATSASKTLRYQVDKPDYLSNSIRCNKKVDFAASVQITLRDAQTIVIIATTNNDATTKKAIDDFRAELVKQFAK
jgi:hypothetical protein